VSDRILNIEGLRVAAQTDSGETSVLVDGVNLILSRGEVLGLIGESGAGKSTLGLSALGYTRPGCVMVNGAVMLGEENLRTATTLRKCQIRGARIAYISQSAAASFNPAKTIMWQVCEAPIRHGLLKPAEARRRAVQLFAELDLPEPEKFGDRYPHQASGGQLQRAMTAMAMSCQPDVLVLDEPTTALDVTTQIEVLFAIRNLIRSHHTAGLYISHDLAVVAQIADRIMVLRHGRLVEQGTTAQILREPKEDYTRRLVATRKLPSVKREPVAATQSAPLLKVEDVSAFYGKFTAVEGASLDLYRSETVAIVGESGSGKSTLARAICGAHASYSGTVRLAGQALKPSYEARTREALRRIQMIYQMPDVALNPRHTVGEIIGRPISFYFNPPAKEVTERLKEMLRMIDLPLSYANRLSVELSGGQKQRVCIARALAARPDVIICDEVTSSLDQLVAEEILQLLERLQQETKVAYLFITHDLTLVRRLAHRVVVMLKGRVVDHGTLSEVFAPPKLPYTELLLLSMPQMRTDWLDEVMTRRKTGVPPSKEASSLFLDQDVRA
jgi:peptide/nickel transport system ATP-binding protein